MRIYIVWNLPIPTPPPMIHRWITSLRIAIIFPPLWIVLEVKKSLTIIYSYNNSNEIYKQNKMIQTNILYITKILLYFVFGLLIGSSRCNNTFPRILSYRNLLKTCFYKLLPESRIHWSVYCSIVVSKNLNVATNLSTQWLLFGLLVWHQSIDIIISSQLLMYLSIA